MWDAGELLPALPCWRCCCLEGSQRGFWLWDALEQPGSLQAWGLQCQSWAGESHRDPGWLLEAVYGNLGNSTGFVAHHGCKAGASQPSAPAGPGVGVISPCTGRTGLLIPLEAVVVSAAMAATLGPERCDGAALVARGTGSTPSPAL